MAGTIIVSTVKSDTDNSISFVSNTGATIFSANLSGGVSTANGINFTMTGARIRGDFSNGTFANRVAFQTSTANGNSVLTAIPNGTATTSSLDLFNNSDPTNSARVRMYVTPTVMGLDSNITGTGTYLPMTFYTNNAERMRIDTSGNVSIGGSSITRLGVAGAISFLANVSAPAVDASVYRPADGTLGFVTNGTERLRITSDGGVSFGSSGTAYGTAGQVLTSQGNAPPTWSSAYSGPQAQTFTGNGTFTIPSGITRVKVTVVAGGGGGAGSSGNGGTGGTTSVASGTQTITTISATGGAGGNQSTGVGGAGGIGSNGDLNIGGSSGGTPSNLNNALNCTTIYIAGGYGGSSILGGGGNGASTGSASAGRAYGGGGGAPGRSLPATTGGQGYGGGGGGGAAIKWLTGLTPGNTLAVTVGGAGTAGTGSGTAGAAGVVIFEY